MAIRTYQDIRYGGDNDGDDDIDGRDFDPDDPQDWWKSKSGRKERS